MHYKKGKIGELFVFNNVGRDKVDSAKAGRWLDKQYQLLLMIEHDSGGDHHDDYYFNDDDDDVGDNGDEMR